MIDYVTYDADGNLDGGYLQEVAITHLANHIVVTPEQRLAWPAYRANTDRSDVELIVPVPVPVSIPESVPMRNARLALYAAGLLSDVQTLIDGMEGEDGDLARIDWATALTVRRDSPLVARMVLELGKTDAEIDALFLAAAAIQ